MTTSQETSARQPECREIRNDCCYYYSPVLLHSWFIICLPVSIISFECAPFILVSVEQWAIDRYCTSHTTGCIVHISYGWVGFFLLMAAEWFASPSPPFNLYHFSLVAFGGSYWMLFKCILLPSVFIFWPLWRSRHIDTTTQHIHFNQTAI